MNGEQALGYAAQSGQTRMVNPGAIIAPGFGDLADGLVRPSNIY
ncbi:hypothetical protein OIE68_10240 [Nocardia vinacea]|uniref:Uncharacterized protein n=1 Tax=Nocardia vinacea TaxID=96468 RepID=A0ABZ1YRI3_9NOCA|nr:hypothetical protein OIE68_10240 [Nocardia vinacea]